VPRRNRPFIGHKRTLIAVKGENAGGCARVFKKPDGLSWLDSAGHLLATAVLSPF
jgi:hypothetical protein